MGKGEELFDIVDEQDRVIGQAPRRACHGDPSLIHRVAHVLVLNRHGELLLQKRSLRKDIQPGKWDTSVGGHLDPGEDYQAAAVREMGEELGVHDVPLTFLYRSQIRNEIESENVSTYLACCDGPFVAHPDEIDELRFWGAADIDAALGSGRFTPNFEEEWSLFQDWQRRYPVNAAAPVAFCAGDTFPDLLTRLRKDD